jgi:hypothetical protein
MFAQEARPYAQFLFLFLATCYLFIRAWRERRGDYWCGFLGASILLIYTHYFGLLALGVLTLYGFIYRKQYRLPISWWIGGATLILLAYLPWLTSGIFQAAAHNPKTFSGRNAFWSVGSTTLVTAINFFGNGKPEGLLASSPVWTFAAGGLLFLVPATLAFFVANGKTERQGAVFVAMLCVLPILGAIAAGLLHFQYNIRYVAFCAAPYYILVARGIAVLRPAALRFGLVVLLLAYTANSLRANYFMSRKEDFRSAGAYIRQNLRAGDCGVFLPGFVVPLQWNITQGDAPMFRVLHPQNLNLSSSDCARIWDVSWSISGNPWQWQQAKEERRSLFAAYAATADKDFFWVHVTLFGRKDP